MSKIPHAVPPLMAPVPAQRGAAQAAGRLRRGGVLVIDDDPAVREFMQGLLAAWGRPVMVAASLQEAVATAAPAEGLALVLTDYRLGGGVTGIQAVEAVERHLGYQVSAVLITGDTSPEPITEAARHGMRLVYKPVGPRVLAELLKSIQ